MIGHLGIQSWPRSHPNAVTQVTRATPCGAEFSLATEPWRGIDCWCFKPLGFGWFVIWQWINETDLFQQVKMRELGYCWDFLSRVSSAKKFSFVTSFTLTSVPAWRRAVCLRCAGGIREILSTGWPSISPSSLFLIVPSPFLPWPESTPGFPPFLPASSSSIAVGSPQGYRNIWNLDMHYCPPPSPHSFCPLS